jgi:hypothetical protein
MLGKEARKLYSRDIMAHPIVMCRLGIAIGNILIELKGGLKNTKNEI